MNRRVVSAALHVPLPPEAAFRLFTARGERDWVPGWEPVFPVGTPDDTAPGTVWLTSSDGEERPGWSPPAPSRGGSPTPGSPPASGPERSPSPWQQPRPAAR